MLPEPAAKIGRQELYWPRKRSVMLSLKQYESRACHIEYCIQLLCGSRENPKASGLLSGY